MNSTFDLDKANKRMPYTTPSDDFFDKLEENIWNEVKDDYLAENSCIKEKQDNPSEALTHPRHSKLSIVMKSALAVAAVVVVAFFINRNLQKPSMVSINDVDQAFNQLSPDDQAYLINVYQDDVFMSE